MKKKYITLIMFLAIFGCEFFCLKMDLRLSNMDSIIIEDFESMAGMIPGSYVDEEKNVFYWKTSGIFGGPFDLKIDENVFSISVSEPFTDNSTVVFSDFFQKSSVTRRILIEELRKSEKFVWISIYDIDDRELIEELERLHRNGIEIRIIIEKDNYDSRLDYLYSEGLVKFDGNSKLMHDKFAIIDGAVLITGSSNFTGNGFENNSNNLNIFYSNRICESYMREFKALNSGLFGASSRKNVAAPEKIENVFTGSATVSAYFSASDDVKSVITDLIDNSTVSLDIMMFTFTDRDIANSLICAINRGVKVRIIAETFQASNQWSVTDFLEKNGAELVLDENPKVFHHKVMIIDGKSVATGSYNYTLSAGNYNDENIIIIESDIFSDAYLKCFNEFWEKWNEK